MEVVRWVASFGLAALWLLIAWYNGCLAWQQFVRRNDDGRGFFPLFGGMFGTVAVLVTPLGSVSERAVLAWLPAVLDLGCLPYLLMCLVPR